MRGGCGSGGGSILSGVDTPDPERRAKTLRRKNSDDGGGGDDDGQKKRQTHWISVSAGESPRGQTGGAKILNE